MKWTVEDWGFLQDAVNGISRGEAIIDRLLAKAGDDGLPNGGYLHLGDAHNTARHAAALAQMVIDAHRDELVRTTTVPDGDSTVAAADVARKAAEAPGLANLSTRELLDRIAGHSTEPVDPGPAATYGAPPPAEPTGEFAPKTVAEPPAMSFLEREMEDMLVPAFHLGLAKRGPDGLVYLTDPPKVAPPNGSEPPKK